MKIRRMCPKQGKSGILNNYLKQDETAFGGVSMQLCRFSEMVQKKGKTKQFAINIKAIETAQYTDTLK